MSESELDVSIAGGGISGLCLARCLLTGPREDYSIADSYGKDGESPRIGICRLVRAGECGRLAEPALL